MHLARLLPSLAILAVTACTQMPTTTERAAETSRLERLARARPLTGDAAVARQHELAALLASDKPGVAARAAFALASSGFADAASLLEKNLPEHAPAEVIAAAAMGLAPGKSAGTENLLVALALRPEHAPAALEALYTFYRQPGAKPAPTTLPAAGLLAYAAHPEPRGRAALGHLGRAIKDAALIAPLTRLSTDADFEVRRAAILGLTEGPAKNPRPADQRAACLAAILPRLQDADTHVVIAACRATASYDDTSVVAALTGALSHADFNVRVAALEGLGRRKAKTAGAALAQLARTDPSVSVRATAAEQLSALDPEAARPLADGLLADANEYVRAAGTKVLATSPDPAALARLAQLAKNDPHARVRESAIDAFAEHTGSTVAQEALRTALADADPVLVATACEVVGKAKLAGFSAGIAALPARFPGNAGADAREAALNALAALDSAAFRPLFEAHLTDSHPAVRDAAAKALAGLDKKDPPPPSRGADLTGPLLPGGAPVFGPEVFLVLETGRGTMKIKLFTDLAPVHCAHVAALARAGFYNGLTWHRVVPDFVIQGGCPRGDGSGAAGASLPLEPTQIPFERGTLGMPRSGNPDSGGCQLFICHSRAPNLDVAYTAFGRVVEGFDVIDRIDVDTKIVRARIEGAH